MKTGPVYKSPVSRSIPYDDTIQVPLSGTENVQDILDWIKNRIAISASPGFTWGRSGNVVSGTWLQNDTVPSNTTGRQIGLTDAKIERVFLANEGVSTYSLEIYEHDGTTFTLLTTVVNTAVNVSYVDLMPPIAVTTGKMLAVKLSAGSAKNIVFCAVLSGIV